MAQEFCIIKTLDNTPRLIFFKIDDVAVVIIPFFIGMFFGLLWLMPLGFVLVFFYGKLKKKYPRSILQHYAYWTLPKRMFTTSGIFKNLPPSHKREYTL